MEVKFKKTVCPYLRRVTEQVMTEEKTQEIRIPDGMPDIGRILGCWGQVLTRGKEWRSEDMQISGGIMGWVLYLPEDGTEPRVVEGWLPFQMKWDFPETQRDGSILARAAVKSMDARSTSARKIMLRATLSVLGSAYEPVETEYYTAETVPEDLQILQNTYPLVVAREAGEKSFQIDEELTIPDHLPPVHKLIHYHTDPQITEQKVLAGKLVFKGSCSIRLVYMDDGGTIHSVSFSQPFSQFAELDREHDNTSDTEIIPLVTGLELDREEEGRLHFRCSMTGQYLLYDRVMVDVVEDAYSPQRKADLSVGELRLPILLERKDEKCEFETQIHADGQKVLDEMLLADHPICAMQNENAKIHIPLQYQMLYTDPNGSLQCSSIRTEANASIPSEPGNETLCTVVSTEYSALRKDDEMLLSGSVNMLVHSFRDERIQMITGISLGELLPADPMRPSLILRRSGEHRLWDIAKACGSTVDAIMQANNLQQEPEKDRYLLIPVC